MVCTRCSYWAERGNCGQENSTEKKQSCLFFPNHLLPQNGSSSWSFFYGHLIFQCAFYLVLSTYDEEVREEASIKLNPKSLLDSLCYSVAVPWPTLEGKTQRRIPLPLYFPIPRSHTSGTRIEFIQSISDSFSNSLFMASRVVCSTALSSAFLSWWRQEREWMSNA